MLSEYTRRWQLVADGPPIETPGSRLLPVRWRGQPAMLKIALHPEELPGFDLMAWWDGDGAARVFARAGPALLLERAQGGQSLSHMSHSQDDAACHILCAVVERLHAPQKAAPAGLTPLNIWFRGLEAAARQHGGLLQTAHATASQLLAAPQQVRCLHGDIHHGNVLDFGARGWLAIDPKGLIGERGFDYANLFCNPDRETAGDANRFGRRVTRVAEAASLERLRLLQWILAWSGLSFAWHLEDGTPGDTALQVAALAAAALHA